MNMKTNLLKTAMIAVISVMLSVNVYKTLDENSLPENVLVNVEALADEEYGGLCLEWVDKNCWQPDQFASIHSSDYHAVCSGMPSTPGGKSECGTLSSLLPLSPYEPGVCLQCVRTRK